MKSLFLTAAKLLGLLQTYWALTYFFSMLSFALPGGSFEAEGAGAMAIRLGGLIFYAGVSFGLACLLLFRTEWLAGKLRIPEEGGAPGCSGRDLLRTGMQLIGVGVLVISLPDMVQAIILRWGYSAHIDQLFHILSILLPSVLKLSLGLFLVLRVDPAIRLLERGERVPGGKIILGGFMVVVLLILLARGLEIRSVRAMNSVYTTRVVDVPDTETSRIRFKEAPSTSDLFSLPDAGVFTNGASGYTNATLDEVIEYMRKENERRSDEP